MLIAKLKRQVWAYSKPRRGEVNRIPRMTHVGPKAVLINYWSGSDGDIFPASFKLNRLGPVIGMRTWGGVVGIRGDKRFIDGGLSTQPEFAWWGPGQGWGLENRGVEPDIEVDYRPEDYLAGRDPQLERAIEVLEKELGDRPPVKPPLPAFPDKSRIDQS